MSCLGNDLNSVINRMDNNIRTIIKTVSPDIKIDENGVLKSKLPKEQIDKIQKQREDELFKNQMSTESKASEDNANRNTNAKFDKELGIHLEKMYTEIRDYLSNYLPGSLQNYSFFKRNPTTGEIMYQFPTELKVAFEQKMQMDKQQEETDKQAALAMSTEQAAINFMENNPENLEGGVNINDPMFFSPEFTGDFNMSDFQQEYNEPDPQFDVNQNNIDVERGDASLLQYVRYKKDLLQSLKKSLSNFVKTNRKGTPYYIEMLKKFNRSIETLAIDIENLDSNKNKLEVTYQDVSKEIDYLNSILDSISIDSIDVTALLTRLDALNKFFNNKDINNKAVGEEYKNSNLFWVRRGEINGYEAMSVRVRELIDKWQKKQTELIKNIMESNPIVQQHIREGRLRYIEEDGTELTGEETMERIKQYIDNPDDTNFFISKLYGAAIGGDIFGQILDIERKTALRNRQGETGSIMQGIDAVFDRLKDKAEKGKNIFEEFIQKDSLGVKTDRLISKFSSDWFKYTAKRNKLFNIFLYGSQESSTKSQNYKMAMAKKKANEDVFIPGKLKYFKDKYNSIETEQYFKYTEAEMEEYEKELIDTLGLNFFNSLMKDQDNKIQEWIETVMRDDLASRKFKFETNPFEFAEHYYSQDYYKPVNGNYLYSKYTVGFPLTTTRDKKKALNYFNQDFTEIENDPDKFEFWNLVSTLLTEYINTELQANGENVNLYELPMLKDLLGNEIIRNAALGQKGLMWSKNLFNSWSKMFASSAYANLDKDGNKMNTGYSNSISRRAKEIEKLMKTYKIEELSKIANQEGINYNFDVEYLQKLQGIDNGKSSPENKKKQKDYIEQQERTRLAKAIANKRTFSPTDEDFVTILRSLAAITDSLSARQSSLNIARILENYVNSKSGENGQPLLKHTSEWFDSYIKRNLFQDTVHGDREKNADGSLKIGGKILGKKLKILNLNKGIQKLFSTKDFDVPALDWSKFMSTEDKQFYNFLKEEIKNIDSRDNFDFTFEDKKYTTEGGKYFIQENGQKKEPIERKAIEQKYAEYLGQRAESLGIDRTIGSMLNGFLSVFVQKALALNPKSGYRNLWEGGTKNMQIAASGRYGFGLEELQHSKDFLWGINTDRYLETVAGKKMLSINRISQDHAYQIRTYKMLIQQFGLVQDRKNESARAEDFDSKKRQFKFSLMDFAVENPEAHNQGELILSKLQKTYINYIDENGETKQRAIFDGEKGDFIWIPGTLTIKDEYRTEENVRMWESFLESRGENNQHLTTITGIQALIERTQGNYSDGDIVAIQGSTLGRMLMTFKRFYPEHFWQNYGMQKFDLIKGETNFKGRKTAMLQHAPVTAAYLAAIGALSLTGGIGLFIGGGMLLSFITQYGINRFVNKNKQKMKMDIESLKLSLGFTLEMLTRSIDRPLEMIMRGKTPVGKYWLTHTVMGKTQGLNPENMPLTSKERTLLSENAQEIAQRVNLILSTALILTVMKAIVALISGDDDDEYEENMKKIEGTMNLVLNTANTLNSQLNEMNNPVTFLSNVSKISLFGTLENAQKSIETIEKVIDGEKELSAVVSPIMKSFNPVPIPNLLTDQFFREGVGFMSDARVYNTYWWNGMKDDSEKKIKRKVRVQRASLRDEIEDYYFKKFKEEYPNESYNKINAQAKRAAKKEIAQRYSKDTGETGEQILERVNFKGQEKAWKNGEIEPNFSWEDVLPEDKDIE